MICPQCYGKRETRGQECSYCFGVGIISCCEGSERHGQLEFELRENHPPLSDPAAFMEVP